jgi:hypothetical protein
MLLTSHMKGIMNAVKDETLVSMHVEPVISVINTIRSDMPPKVWLDIAA